MQKPQLEAELHLAFYLGHPFANPWMKLVHLVGVFTCRIYMIF
jgi:hypothetical protein